MTISYAKDYNKSKPYYTYAGSFDDFAARHWKHEVDLGYVNGVLIREVLIGGRLLINDGYLVQLPAFRQAIMDPKVSPLKELVRCGWVKILTRTNGRLDEVAEKMVAKQVKGFSKRLRDKEYQEVLRIWSDELERDAFIPWPDFKIHVGYANTMALAEKQIESKEVRLDISQEVIRQVFDMFNNEMARDKEAPRTKWERIVSNLRSQGKLKPNNYLELMRLANATYHYNFGCCLTESYPELPMRVDTHAGSLFHNLRAPTREFLPLPKKLPKLDCPEEKLKIERNWALLSDLVERTRSKAQILKYKYLDGLAKYINNPKSDETRNELKKSCVDYSKELSRHFGATQSSKFAKLGFDLIFLGSSTAVGFIIRGTSGSVVGGLVGLAGVGASFFPIPQLVEMYKTKGKRVIEFKEYSTEDITSGFALKKEAVKQHMKGVPRFKE